MGMIRSDRPACSASPRTGTSPAADTRLRSSNTADSAVKVCDDCTESAFPRVDNRDVRISILPLREALSSLICRWFDYNLHGLRLSRGA